MSETETPPLDPQVDNTTQDTETAVEAEATPAAPDFSKLLQREQMERANLTKSTQKRLDNIEKLLQRVAEGNQSRADSADDLTELDQYAATMEAADPAMGKALKKLVSESRSSRGFRKEIDDMKAEAQAKAEYDEYMSQYPPEFRKAYTAKQRELIQEAKDAGEEVTEKELRLALKEWVKTYEASEGEEVKPAPKTAAARPAGRVIPAGSGARLSPMSAFEKLQKGIGGNLLGIKMKR